jgi:hypothetical protein
VFHNAAVFTQNIYVIKETDYLANTACLEGNAGCYDTTNIISVYNPAFTANVANPAAITLTI